MNIIQGLAAAVAIISVGIFFRCGTLKQSKYIVTYEASLKAGGWTHGEVALTTDKLSNAGLDNVRAWVRSNRVDITEAVCIMSVVKLDE